MWKKRIATLPGFQKWIKETARPHDLPSINQFCNAHHQHFVNHYEPKFMRTSDQATLGIAHDVLKNNQFLMHHIMNDFDIRNKTTEVNSIPVQLCSIRENKLRMQQYQSWKQGGKGRIVAVGGPAANTQALMASMIPQIKKNNEIHFYCASHYESNSFHSAWQSVARYSASLNSIPVFSGYNILKSLVHRHFHEATMDQICDPHARKVHVKFNSPQYCMEYVKNQINGYIQNIKKSFNIKNEHHYNWIEGISSQCIQRILSHKIQAQLPDIRPSNHSNPKSLNIHFTFSEAAKAIAELQQSAYSHIQQLKVNKYSNQTIRQMFPEMNHLVAAYETCEDFPYHIDTFNREKEICLKLGVQWSQNKRVSKVYVDKDREGVPFACGLEFTDNQFIPANKIHLTLGYKAKYEYQDSSVKPLESSIFPATGVSTVLLFKITQNLRKLISERNRQIRICTISSHWSIIQYNEEYALVRATAGANTGVQTYMPEYLLNLVSNTRNIFGQAFIGIVSSYGCPRSINYKNATQIAELAEGLVIGYGKGGIGVTKKCSQAYKVMKYLGFDEELKRYFKGHQQRLDIVNALDEICKDNKKTKLFYSSREKTLKALFV